MRDKPRSVTTHSPQGNPSVVLLSADVLQNALTPRGLFTNLFPIHFSSPNLGALRQTTKAEKEEFVDRRRPSFYQSGDSLYAYGPGLEDFKDSRFTPGIVPMEKEPDLTRHLLKLGLADFFREHGYLVRFRRVGISIIDHNTTIAEADSQFLRIYPEYTFQTYRVEGAEGNPIYSFSVEPSWATVPAFEIGPRVEKHSALLENLKVVLKCPECGPHCPLFDELDRVIGVFQGFADPEMTQTSACLCEDYTPQLIRVHERKSRKGKVFEKTHVLPGQVVHPASSQRKVLKLFKDRGVLERKGRIWIGDLNTGGGIRSGALQVRYERIQHFLARVVGSATDAVTYTLPTGPKVALQRLPLTVEEIAHA